ncbi:hypothetical protein ACIHQR_05855 [Corallococcus coralloides]|uniref:hypothetical protein n=1 Tax=Corallococcus coralloides TaxID=184914 RepID=UPI00384E6733
MASAIPIRRALLSLGLLAMVGLPLAAQAEKEQGPRLELEEALQVRLDQQLRAGDPATVRLRRGRVGVRLRGLEWVRGSVEVSFDGVTLLPGPVRGPSPALHEASATFTVLPHQVWLSVGWFRPQLGRESLTSGFVVDSLDKAFTQGPLRQYLTGAGAGRAPGLDVGGLVLRQGWSVRYDAGVVMARPGPDGEGRLPLLLARAALTLGMPEAETYALGLPMNDLGLRQGLTLALQGSTDAVGDAHSLGVDALLRLRPVVVSAELHQVASAGGRALLAHVRAGVNLPGPGATVMEPWVMVARTAGEGLEDSARGLRLEGGLSWYVDHHAVRATLGGSWRPSPRDATSGAASPAPTGLLGLSLQHRR